MFFTVLGAPGPKYKPGQFCYEQSLEKADLTKSSMFLGGNCKVAKKHQRNSHLAQPSRKKFRCRKNRFLHSLGLFLLVDLFWFGISTFFGFHVFFPGVF